MTGDPRAGRGPLGAGAVHGLALPTARLALLYLVVTDAARAGVLWPVLVRPWLVVVTLGATALAALLLTAPGGDPLPLRQTVAVAALPALDVACLLPQLDAVPDRAWLATGACLAGLLAVRGRVLPAAVGAAVALGVFSTWAVAHGSEPGHPAAVALLLAGPVTAGALWRRALGRSVAAIGSGRSEAELAELGESAARRATAAAAAELRAIGHEAAPLLRRIAAGGTPTAAERTEMRLLEARLRDRIRAKALALEPVAGACDTARRNGADVLLLDDGGGSVELPTRLLERVASVVRGVAGGRVTVRVLPPGRDALVTVLVDQGGRVRAEALGATGKAVGSTSPSA